MKRRNAYTSVAESRYPTVGLIENNVAREGQKQKRYDTKKVRV